MECVVLCRLEASYVSLVQLIETEPLPDGLVLSEELDNLLRTTLRGAVFGLVQELELMVPVLSDALDDGDHTNILNAIMQFLGMYRYRIVQYAC